MLLLCKNPDGKPRKAYLVEINKYIVPIAENNVPSIFDFFVQASTNADLIGYARNE